jgi:hypothetical protein
MSVLRVLAVLPVIAMLTGCMIDTMYDTLKSDVRALRVYLANNQVPEACKPPGQNDSSKTCLYRLQITDVSGSAKGMYQARIHPSVYEENAIACPKVNESLLPAYKSLAYDCPPLKDAQGNPTDFSKNSPFFPDARALYTFNAPDESDVKVGPDPVEFLSIPGTKQLRKIKADEKRLY